MRIGLPGRVLAAVVHAAAVEPGGSPPGTWSLQGPPARGRRASQASRVERAPKAQREGDDQEPVEVRCDLVVEPGLVGRLRADVADVVVGRAERVGLSDIAEQEAGDEVTGASSPQIAAARSGRRSLQSRAEAVTFDPFRELVVVGAAAVAGEPAAPNYASAGLTDPEVVRLEWRARLRPGWSTATTSSRTCSHSRGAGSPESALRFGVVLSG